MNGRFAGRFLRIAFAVGLTAYLLWRSNPSAVLEAATHSDLAWILPAVALVFVDRTLMAARWVMLLCIVGEAERPPLMRVMEVFFVSTFVGTFLPASVGGDAVRAYSISRERVTGADAVASVFMDRMIGVAALLVMGVAGLFFARDLASNRLVLMALAITAAVSAITMLMIFSERVGLWSARVIGAVRVPLLHRTGHAIIASVQRYARFHARLANVLIASIAVQVLRVFQAYCLGRALGIGAGLALYFAFVPLILLVMLLPVTVNGLGTSQAAFVWFFARAGVDSAPAFALSVLFLALGIVGNLPGGLLYVVNGMSSASGRGGPQRLTP